MGTRSRIAKEDSTGITMVYCHWDGYLDHNGRILLEHYQDAAKVDELLSFGDISSLGKEVGTKHNFDEKPKDQTNYYGRDRGESNIEAKHFPKLVSIPGSLYEEFFYLYRDGKWYFSDHGNFNDLLELTKSAIEAE